MVGFLSWSGRTRQGQIWLSPTVPGEVRAYNQPLCPSPVFDAVTSNCAFSELWGHETFWTAATNAEEPDDAVAVKTWGWVLEVEENKTSKNPVIAVRGGRRND